jgi:hypothetical protein
MIQAKKRANFTSFKLIFLPIFKTPAFYLMVSLAWQRTLYQRKLAMDTSHKVVGKLKGP